jgi:hypothetical protein
MKKWEKQRERERERERVCVCDFWRLSHMSRQGVPTTTLSLTININN